MLFGNKLEYYKRLADISIYRWDMLHEEENFRWLIEGNNSDIKISTKNYNRLGKIYAELLFQFNGLELKLLKKKLQIAIKVIDFVIESLNSTDIEVLENVNIIMRGLLTTSDPETDWLYDVKIAETADQRAMITDLAIAIKDFNRQKETEKDAPKISLQQRAARISSTTGIKIDIKKDSVLDFIAYQKEAINKIKAENGRG